MVREQEKGTNAEMAPQETKQDETHQESEDEGPSGCQDQENSKVHGNVENHGNAEDHDDAQIRDAEDNSNSNGYGIREQTQHKGNGSSPSTRALAQPRPRIPIYDPSVGDWV